MSTSPTSLQVGSLDLLLMPSYTNLGKLWSYCVYYFNQTSMEELIKFQWFDCILLKEAHKYMIVPFDLIQAPA